MYHLDQTRQMEISPDCIKTCPFEPGIVAMAYYQTNPTTKGAISVTYCTSPNSIHDIQLIQSPPLLHLVWGKCLLKPQCYLLAAAVRSNDVIFFSYDPQQKKLQQERVVHIAENAFCLYLDLQACEGKYNLIVSTNDSEVFNLTLDQEFNVLSRSVFNKHEYAVWTCRLNPFQSNFFVCGDEVNSIYLYNENQLVSKNSTSHSQGICDLVFTGEYQLYSGGFDGVVCSYDTRKFKEHVSKKDWGGTIWRIIPKEKDPNTIILCNSSENKFQVVDNQESKELWNSKNGHKSLAYAADWVGKDIITASFYDKTVCYWSSTS